MKKNKKRINTSKVVIIFSLILIVVIVLYTSLNSGIFNSDNIEIEGNKYVESEYIIKALEVMPDHIHIFLSAPQTVAPCDIARTLKSCSAIKLFAAYPELKSFYARCGVLWSRGYYIASVGHISAETVKRYIEEQKD